MFDRSGNDFENSVRRTSEDYSAGTTSDGDSLNCCSVCFAEPPFSANKIMPSIESKQVWGVLHSIHSAYSDGDQSPINRPGILRQNYGWASIIDHVDNLTDTKWSGIIDEANSNNEDGSFTYFPGYEWDGKELNALDSYPHVTVFFPDSYPANLSSDGGETFGSLAAFLQSYGALGCINHPSDSGRAVDWTNLTTNSPYLPCVEMLNKAYYHWSDTWECAPESGCTTYYNPKQNISMDAGGTVRLALNRGFHMGFVAGWDYHGTGSKPTAYTGLVLDNNSAWTRDGIASVIKRRHTWAAEERTMMDVHTTVNSTIYTMGDQFRMLSNSLPIDYNFTASTGNQIAKVNVFYNGVIVKSMPVAAASVTGTYSQSLRSGVEDYIFFEVIQNNSKRAWSSPMYVTASTNCTSITCDALSYNCGSWSDSCGGTLNCGACPAGYACTSGICTINNTPPNTPSAPRGPANGNDSVIYSYSTSATDPDEDRVKYTFDWGDGTTSTTKFVDSGITIGASHRWNKAGSFQIKVMATDSKGAISKWSSPLDMKIGLTVSPVFNQVIPTLTDKDTFSSNKIKPTRLLRAPRGSR